MTQEDQKEERSHQQAADQVFPVIHRRRFFEIAGLTAATAALASCGIIGQPSSSPNQSSSGSGWAKGIHIRFFVGGNPGDAFASIVLNGAKKAQADLGPTVQLYLLRLGRRDDDQPVARGRRSPSRCYCHDGPPGPYSDYAPGPASEQPGDRDRSIKMSMSRRYAANTVEGTLALIFLLRERL